MSPERHFMNIYQILIPELGTSVKFKVLTVSDVEEFIKKNKDLLKKCKKDHLLLITNKSYL